MYKSYIHVRIPSAWPVYTYVHVCMYTVTYNTTHHHIAPLPPIGPTDVSESQLQALAQHYLDPSTGLYNYLRFHADIVAMEREEEGGECAEPPRPSSAKVRTCSRVMTPHSRLSAVASSALCASVCVGSEATVCCEATLVETTSVSLVADTRVTSHPAFHQYATLMSPNQGETAVCGSSIFVG